MIWGSEEDGNAGTAISEKTDKIMLLRSIFP